MESMRVRNIDYTVTSVGECEAGSLLPGQHYYDYMSSPITAASGIAFNT